jgi:hypothetical protein
LCVEPAEAAAIMLALSTDALDTPTPLAPASLMAGLKHAPRVAKPEQQPAQHFVVRW